MPKAGAGGWGGAVCAGQGTGVPEEGRGAEGLRASPWTFGFQSTHSSLWS